MRVEPIKKLKKILATLAMLPIIFLTLVMPVQAEQSAVESPAANFFAFSTSGDAPFDAAFMDSTTGNPTEWYWEFGDGATSTKQDPDHTYSEPGSYTVTLTVTNDAGSDEKTITDYIEVKESETNLESKTNTEPVKDPEIKENIESTETTVQEPVADFFAFFTSGNAPHTTEFMDQSTGNPTDWYWDFGDGGTSTQRDPVHKYSEPGSYTVTLTVSNDAGSDEKTITDYITVEESGTDPESKTDVEPVKDPETATNIAEKPVAKFSATPKSGIEPLTIEFTDKSTGDPTDWYWDFGDGSTSDSENPVHEYSQAGTYTVILTVSNDAGSDEKTRTDYIVVKESETSIESKKDAEPVKDPETKENIESTETTVQEPVADFFAFFTSGNAPHTTEFMDKSTGNPTDWYWDFGDGGTSAQRDPVHKYSEPGSYTVTLTVSNDAGSDEKTITDYIVVKESATNTAEKTVSKSSSSSKESTKNTKISASKSVSLSYLQVAAKTDPARSQGKTTPGATDSVKIVEAALVKEGYLDDTYAHDGAYRSTTIDAYKKWQESLGSPSKYCDGVPGRTDLTKLGDKYGFTVDSSSISDSDPSDSNADTNFNTPVYKQPAQTTQGSGSDLSETESMPVKSTDTSKGSIFSWKYWSNKLSNPVLAATQEQAPSSSSDPISERVVYAAVNTPEVPFSDGFDFPVGAPDGDGYKHGTVNDKNGWDFVEYDKNKKIYHPGEDWNGVDDKGNPVGNADFGDPVYAISNGSVTYASYYSDAWGNIILIEHRLQDGTPVWSQYAHLKDMLVSSGDIVQRGQKIGTIGKDDGVAHLHFEIRKKELKAGAWDVSSKTKVSEDYYDPSDFINSHRPQKDSTQTDSTQTDSTQTDSTQTGSTMPTTAKESLWESLWHSIEKMTKAKPKYVDDPGDTGIHLA